MVVVVVVVVVVIMMMAEIMSGNIEPVNCNHR